MRAPPGLGRPAARVLRDPHRGRPQSRDTLAAAETDLWLQSDGSRGAERRRPERQHQQSVAPVDVRHHCLADHVLRERAAMNAKAGFLLVALGLTGGACNSLLEVDSPLRVSATKLDDPALAVVLVN